ATQSRSSFFATRSARWRPHFGGPLFLPGDGEAALKNRPAVEAGDRSFNIEHIEQHGHAERRPAAGYGETDARLLQRAHRLARPLGQYLFFGDEGAIHVRQHQRNPALLCHRSLGFAQSSGHQERPSRASSSSAAAGPLLPAASKTSGSSSNSDMF